MSLKDDVRTYHNMSLSFQRFPLPSPFYFTLKVTKDIELNPEHLQPVLLYYNGNEIHPIGKLGM